MKNIGTNIQQARRAKKLKQIELGQLIGLSQARIGQIEAGIGDISEERIAKIAEALDVPVESLTKEGVEDSSTIDDGLVTVGQRLNSRLETINMSVDTLALLSELDAKIIKDCLEDKANISINQSRLIALVIGVKPSWLAFGE